MDSVCDDNKENEPNNHSWLHWSDIVSNIDLNVAYEVAKAHHRGSFLRMEPIDGRRYMPGDNEIKKYSGRELNIYRGGESYKKLNSSKECFYVETRRSPFYFRDNGRFSLNKVSALLEKSFSVQTQEGLRPYPSGGRLYPIEIFLTIFSDGEIQSGFYHYLPWEHAIGSRIIPELNIHDISLGQGQTWGEPAFAFIYVMDLARTIVKYRYRGYRLAMMEAGAMFQQASQIALSLGLRDRVINSFSDHLLTKCLRLNPALFFPLAVQIFGEKHDK